VRGPTPGPFNLFDLIGGTDAGLIHGDCPRECRFLPLPPAIAVARQHQLTVLSLFPFFEATLRGNESARRFLQETLAADNPAPFNRHHNRPAMQSSDRMSRVD
jgi:hypothetical protein